MTFATPPTSLTPGASVSLDHMSRYVTGIGCIKPSAQGEYREQEPGMIPDGTKSPPSTARWGGLVHGINLLAAPAACCAGSSAHELSAIELVLA